MPLEHQQSLGPSFKAVHPVVAMDTRIPPPMKEKLQGDHPGLFLQRARVRAGLGEAQHFVDRVNLTLASHRFESSFTANDLAQYENGVRPISNNDLPYLCETLGIGMTEILYNLKQDGQSAGLEAGLG